ncbi:DMT family transporter [Sanguibacter inulinus]|uniref:DMT family transporter n=1 Tax=Sanguibacter inulinus TaxID=60922 RepID=A0A853EXM8_9MICO|nr:DMT family transporter [Sanguibacter inulinus]MBF0724190.1 DMT family transporter [Sanguibacter inulinus]NYS95335.1 DMT family transporter [Sanguibacter inulinus]
MTKQIGIPAVVVPALLSVVFVLCWSSGFLVAAVDVGAPVATLLTWRFAVVVLLLAVATGVLRRRRQHQAPPRDELGRHGLVGLFSQVGYVVPIYVSVGLGVSTGTTALIDAVQPLVVATLVGPVLGLRVRGAQWAGLAAGAMGVALVVSADLGSGTASWWAYLLPLVAMASLVAATLVERRHPSEASVADTLLLHATVALVVIGGFALLTGQAVPPTTAVFWWTVAFVAVSPTLAAYGLYWYLVRRLGITVLNALLFCVAPTTAVAGALLFGEPLTPLTVAGLALCAAGVGVVITSEARGRRPCAVPARDLVS